ncbi:hypothetical protein LPJ61_004559 [Coemansia biformis]|uniref:DUF1295-domain-containing protein n=1 Tax=Coemansia biformis TaxID=1286918 RepID=A0A9W7YAF7_9FUNG|nr:hypothetical protein LPJ61_004559 [Coemansia biformis]
MESCGCPYTASAKAFAMRVYEEFPFGNISPNERKLFWSLVATSWLVTFVRQNGQRNYSIVDRLWPLLPAGLVVQWTWDSGVFSTDANTAAAAAVRGKALMAVALVLVWSVRLCYNSVRRGDYAWGAEDYRWLYVRKHMGSCWAVWEMFNLLFVSLFQISVVYLMAVPVRSLIWHSSTAAGGVSNKADDGYSGAEAMLLAAMVALLVGEAVADQQQYDLQMLKRKAAPETIDSTARRAEVEAGFVHTGLWRYSRHPNVFCEAAFWVTMGVFCARATGTELASVDAAWLLAGPLLLALLVQASVRLTEQISSAKYPLYRAYQMRTSRLLPMPPLSNEQVIGRAHRHQA